LEQAGIVPVSAALYSRIRLQWANFMEFGGERRGLCSGVFGSVGQKAKHCEAVSRMVDRKNTR
jgi:hypothetical protein